MPDFLLEIGTEELPASFIDSAIAQWQAAIPASLAAQDLVPHHCQVYATPRRLAVVLTGLPDRQPDRQEEVKGPPAQAAFKNGQPTAAAAGFARKQGLTLESLVIRSTDKGEFVFATKQSVGQPVTDLLPSLAHQWITGLEGQRFMRWGDGDLRFPRPIRWLVALLDDAVLPLELVNGATTVASDRQTRGHRILHPEPVPIPRAAAYADGLRAASVIVDPAARRAQIERQVQQVAAQAQGHAVLYPDLLAEVTQLVEWPTAVLGEFDAAYLELPSEVITTVMVRHQRYFPVRAAAAADSPLRPYFITIANGDPAKAAAIATGNARVIRARLADAQFFYRADCTEPLEAFLPQLEDVTFQEDLGSMHDKVERIIEASEAIASQLHLHDTEREAVERAALLCKADLVSQMVYEFPELQGIMGQKYALASGEAGAVATAIYEHYLPRTADDLLPATLVGQVVGLADRLDTLVSIFGLGLIPTGSSDPFALRRAANAVINIIWHANLNLDLVELLAQLAADFVDAQPERPSPLEPLADFFLQRVQTLLQDELGIDYDLVHAVLGEADRDYAERALHDLLDARDRARFLQEIRNDGQLAAIYETVNRSTRLAAKGYLDRHRLDPTGLVQPERFEQASERAFYEALVNLVPETEAARTERNYQRLVSNLAKIAPTVSRFFDGEDSVLVMADDPEVQSNRLNLLGLLRNHALVLADFGAIVK